MKSIPILTFEYDNSTLYKHKFFWQAHLVKSGKWTFLWQLVAILTLTSISAFAQKVDAVNEYQLKAVFIYNFSKFIEWPESAFPDSTANFQICVVGNNPFGDALQSLSNRSYRTHPIVIKYPQTLAEVRRCHILYIDDAVKLAPWHELAKNIGDAPVLTVSSGEDATQFGIAIGFVSLDGKIRWVFNLNATRRAQLKVSAKLMEIAVSVIGDTSR